LKSIHQRHVDIQKNDIGQNFIRKISKLFEISEKLNGAFSPRMYINIMCDTRRFNHFLINEIINLIIVNQHDIFIWSIFRFSHLYVGNGENYTIFYPVIYKK